MGLKEVRDLSISVTSIYMKIVGFWLASNYTEECQRKVAILYTFCMIIVAMTIETRDLYFSWGDFSDTIYTTCNVISLIVVFFKILISFVHKKKLLGLIQYAKTNFWHSNYDSYERRIMDTCSRICTLLVFIFTFFAQGTVISYVIVPVLANIGKNESERILPFNMWINGILNQTPYFEMMFMLQVLSLYHVGVSYLCFDNFLCIINLHTACQFRILQHRFANVCNINEYEKLYEVSKNSCNVDTYMTLKTYIQQHQALLEYCTRLEDVFSLIALGQVSLFSLLICLDGYLVLMEEATVTRRLVFAFHIMGCMSQLLMFTYSCDCLIQDSMGVATSAYKSTWSILSMDKYGKMLRNDLMLVVMRSQTPCCLTANGFFIVSLETYTGILSTAVSYFTLLRGHTGDVPQT